MKKIFLLLMIFMFACTHVSWAEDVPFRTEREWFVEESGSLQEIMERSRDAILITSLIDACLITIMQIDAYYTMMAIYNTIPDSEKTQDAAEYIMKWLEVLKKTNDLNLKSLNAMSDPLDLKTTDHVSKMKVVYEKMNGFIEVELDKLTVVKYSK